MVVVDQRCVLVHRAKCLPILLGLVCGSLLSWKVDAQEPAASLVPETTAAFVSVPDLEELVARFESTDLGALASDPETKPFFEDLSGQLDAGLLAPLRRAGMTIDDLKGIRTGEVAVATLVIDSRPATVLLIDVTGRKAAATAVLDRIAANLREEAATELPATELAGVSVRSFRLKREVGELREPRVMFAESRERVVVSNQPEAMEAVLTALASPPAQSLATTTAFRRVQERLAQGRGEDAAEIFWFVTPFELLSAIRQEQVEPGPAFKYLGAMGKTGFDAIRGIGGDLDFAADDLEVRYQTFAVVPGAMALEAELKASARMLSFPVMESFTEIDAFVPAAAASVVTGNWDLGKAFEAAGPLVDQIYEPGTFQRIVSDIKRDRNTNVDLEALASGLGPRFTLATEIVEPYGTASEKLLLSVAIGSEATTLENLERYLAADGFEPREVMSGGQRLTLWEFVDLGGDDAEDDPLGDILDTPPGSETQEDPEQEVLMKAFLVVDDRLLASNDPEYLVALLSGRPAMVEDATYRRVGERLMQEMPTAPSLFRYGRPDRSQRLTFELMRSGELTNSETFLERTLRALDRTQKGVPRKPRVNAEKLPADYDRVVGSRLGPTGWMLGVERDGWYIFGGVLAPPSR